MPLTRIAAAPGVAGPVGAFSPAVVANGFVYTSGQLPTAEDGSVPEGFAAQLDRALTNLGAVLRAAGSDLDHVVKVNGYLADPSVLDTYNRVYREHFGAALPARTTVCVDLWGVSLEIDCVAVVKESGDE
ncbi:RidA family protein [Microbacterium betulae]|uniref:RidA family protein n=1 Tax=Microbacterium betulae TaxID=2981139 RepID=A0AA97FHB3_9MICO|nr:RidA family protein [Microbacterium sp. AB]WOF22903.1 RidA family protein [Microbacterium sp. AB]